MPQTLTLSRNDIQLWKGGTGSVSVAAHVPDINQPLAPTDQDVLAASFSIEGTQPITFGSAGAGGVDLAVSANTAVSLFAVWPDKESPHKDLVAQHGLGQYLATHPGQMLLALQLGAKASVSASAAFRYSVLSAQGTLAAGADGSFLCFKPFDAGAPARQVLIGLFAGLGLPQHLSKPPAPGDVVAFEYGGYLRLGGKISVGYEMQGCPSVDVAGLALTEHCQLSMLGSLSAGGQVAGRFAIEVRGVDGNRAEVIVRRSRSSELNFAADVTLAAENRLDGLPGSSDEFLGALLGVNAQNWLHYLAVAQKVTNFDELEKMTDTLAQKYISRLVDQGWDQIKSNVEPVLARVNQIVSAYQQLDSRAAALIERYFDKIDTVLTTQLDFVANQLKSVSQLGGAISPDLAAVIAALTGGDPRDPLSWVLRLMARDASGSPIQSLDGLREAAQKLLTQIHDGVVSKVVSAIQLAKTEFGLDGLFTQLARIDTAEGLKQAANDAAGGFAQRLVGEVIGKLKKSELKKVFDRVQDVLKKRVEFQEKVYAAFTDAVNSAYSVALHAAYSRSTENQALVDVVIDLAQPAGWELFRKAASGDFADVFNHYDPEVTEIREGAFTRTLTKETGFSVTVMGWHDRFRYEKIGLDRVVTNTEQHVKSEASGGLTIHTTFELKKEKERRSGLQGEEERVYTNLLLRFAGETNGLVAFDKHNQEFLLSAIQALSATYGLDFHDKRTSADELRYYLSFARDFGLDAQGATFEQVEPLMPKAGTGYGAVGADYQVVFDKDGLDALFLRPFSAEELRAIARKVILANYAAAGPWLADIGWCYYTNWIRSEWREKGFAAFENHPSGRTFAPIDPPPASLAYLKAPQHVTLPKASIVGVSLLFLIEQGFVEGTLALQSLIQRRPAAPLSPSDFQEKLSAFGDALKHLDESSEGVNTLFALFDQMIRASLKAGQGRSSGLKLTSDLDGKTLTKMFVAQPPEPVRAAVAGPA